MGNATADVHSEMVVELVSHLTKGRQDVGINLRVASGACGLNLVPEVARRHSVDHGHQHRVSRDIDIVPIAVIARLVEAAYDIFELVGRVGRQSNLLAELLVFFAQVDG